MNLIISLGSNNVAKIAAVVCAFGRYPELWSDREGVEFLHLSASYDTSGPTSAQKKQSKASNFGSPDMASGVNKNPLTLQEIFTGAKNRSLQAYKNAINIRGACDFAVGLEAGVFPVEGANSGFMDISICAIYNGRQFFWGGSPLFEYPKIALDRILKGEEAGLLIEIFGKEGKGRKGAIGPLSAERIYRDEFEELAVLMALCPIVSKSLYQKRKK